MSDFEENSFDKIFSEIAEKEKIENIDSILNEEKIEYAKKYLTIIQSLNYSAIYINDIVTDMILDPDFNIDQKISEIIDKLFVLSEDFHDATMDLYDGIVFEIIDDFEISDIDLMNFEDDIENDIEPLQEQLNKTLDMFKRFKKY